MFSESAGSRKTLGDVDILYHDGLYHLFHLVLPNHDFIAHAVSSNGFNWRRVDNALFIGHPGSWDDLMLWTMHVTPCPHHPGQWRMFYTGLSRRDQGMKQRVGLAVSDDLYTWRKVGVKWEDRRGVEDPEAIKSIRAKIDHSHASSIVSPDDSNSCFPLAPDADFYEASIDDERGWVSFRDPFFYQEQDRGWLLVAGRVNEGPLVRRGCVAVLEEVSPQHFQAQPPLHHPGLYDDIEVPNLLKLEDEYYLIGSIREDSKIRYWHTDRLDKPWRSYYDNVLLAKGNYAGRICRDEEGYLLWNFFSENIQDRTVNNLMPPPKRLIRASNGQLRTKSFEGFEAMVRERVDSRCVSKLKPHATPDHCQLDDGVMRLKSEGEFQAFSFDGSLESFRLCAHMKMTGLGKCGLVFRVDPKTHDGYYLSLDLMKGVAQLRAWATGPPKSGEHMMQFQSLQSAFWYSETPREVTIQLLAFGSYIELMIDGRVLLSLADQKFQKGLVGIYVESAQLEVRDHEIHRLAAPTQSDDHLAQG
jgi:beta-fructofuranosidase